MPRIKERKKYLHEPSVQEIISSLLAMPKYLDILANHQPTQPFSDFLRWVIKQEQYKERTEKLTAKKIAQDFGTDAAKATRWIKNIYDEVLKCHVDHPQLFWEKGIKATLYLKYFDSSCTIAVSLDAVPREYEKVNCWFAKAKVGTDTFWVKRVEHNISNSGQEVFIWLEGGILNKYREYALEKALFQEKIGFMEQYESSAYELDKRLQLLYKD